MTEKEHCEKAAAAWLVEDPDFTRRDEMDEYLFSPHDLAELLLRERAALREERDALAREVASLKRMLHEQREERPSCSGDWVGGSGGHRKHAACANPADWWHPDDMFAYCDAHLNTHDRARGDYWPWSLSSLRSEGSPTKGRP